jgi:UDP-N-acetylglucosamine--N-acetylmuramyl-(pentapeptide) pyrophosphoryl-undecaprenol N-acetylglucosamine transferase
MNTTQRPIRMLLTGGGTGGHLFPGIAAAESLCRRRPGSEVMFVGTHRKMDQQSLSRSGFATRSIHCLGIKGKNIPALLQAVAVLPLSFVEAAFYILRFRPDLVLGVGGYVTGPVVAMAKMLGRPTVIHEQNSVPGLANRKLGRLADRICLSIPGSESYFPSEKVVLTGNPVRTQILELAQGRQESGLKSEVTVLILGGSQGAHRVNELVVEALIRYKQDAPQGLKVIHQTGVTDEDMVRSRYAEAGIEAQVAAFFTDMAVMYGQADLLISRAGATTLAEAAVLKKPAVLVPYPYAADNHQEKNGLYYVKGGGAIMFPERDLTGTMLADTVKQLAGDPKRRQEMAEAMGRLARPQAAEEIIDVCLHMVADCSPEGGSNT